MLPSSVAATLNHLLTQSGWALPRLAKLAGKTAQFQVAPFSFALTILCDGLLRPAEAEVSADATCVIPPSLLPRLALNDAAAFSDIQTSGDPALLAEIFYLSRNLGWDAAEDLSRFTGDLAAERIVQAVRHQRQHWQGGALNLAEALAEYWTEERPLLAKPHQVAEFVRQVDVLRDDLARLEARLAALLQAGGSAA